MIHLLFPHLCAGCGSDLINGHHLICMKCHDALIETGFASLRDNPVEKILWGRINYAQASSHYYFTKDSLLQNLIHQFKYKGNKELAFYFGTLMGQGLLEAREYQPADIIVPLPLFSDKEYRRGYNQSAVLCEGIAAVLKIPVVYNVVKRVYYSGSQTHKTRMERWKNVEGVFACSSETDNLRGKRILLVDDVITTGATIEACGNVLLEDLPDVQLNVVTLAYAIA